MHKNQFSEMQISSLVLNGLMGGFAFKAASSERSFGHETRSTGGAGCLNRQVYLVTDSAADSKIPALQFVAPLLIRLTLEKLI